MKINILILLLFSTLSTFAQYSAKDTAFHSIVGFIQKASHFDHEFPREKVYLHLDNNAYYEDETIWYKAYVMRASTLQASDLSRVLYVELLTDKGNILDRQLLPIDSLGQADGNFNLELPVNAGFYEIRAYTREMMNWGEESYFSRVVPVFNKPTYKRKSEIKLEDINAHNLQIDAPDNKSRNPHLDAEQAQKVKLEFFPEGGNRVAGVSQRIAFLLTDGRGAPLSDSLQIYRNDGALLATVESEHLGMGCFSLPADFPEGGYAITRNKKFDLPETSLQDYALQVTPDGEGATVTVSATPGTEPELLGLVVHCRDRFGFVDTLTLLQEPLTLSLPSKALQGGVNRVELVNSSGVSLSKRLVWKPVPEREIDLHIRQSKQHYDAFAPAALTIDVKDKSGNPVSTTFSLAVRDSDGDLVRDNTPSASADILLSSELKGYIHQPDFYFEKEDEAHRRALDLLLMVQGWSANSFERLCGVAPFAVEQPIEEGLTLNGCAYEYDDDDLVPYPHLHLHLFMYSKEGGSLEAEAVTDENGKFAFVSNVDYTGDWIGQITTKGEDGKKAWSRITLDRWFMPDPRPFNYSETLLEAPMPRIYHRSSELQQELFEWEDTLSDQKSTLLGTAVVKRRKKYKGFTGNKYTYNGGESAGMRMGETYINIEMEAERAKDKGQMPGTLSDLLLQLSPEFGKSDAEERSDTFLEDSRSGNASSTGTGGSSDFAGINGAANDHTLDDSYLTYHGERIACIVNNGMGNIGNENLTLDDIKSVSVVKSGARVERITGGKDAATCPYALFIYEHPEAYRFRSKKGIEKRRIYGYEAPKKFYHPDYTFVDIPSDKDVRRTLYWNPSVQTDAEGKASVLFYTNCREQQELRLSARGVTRDGRLLSIEK